MTEHTLLTRGRETARALLDDRIVERIWNGEPSVWAPKGKTLPHATARAIANRLGWLASPGHMRAHLDHLGNLVQAIRRESLRKAYLLGMGGSSLCAEVLRQVYGVRPDGIDVQVLDTTDAATIALVVRDLIPRHSLFVVASKSGGTVEVVALERFFSRVLDRTVGAADTPSHMIAITDPGTPLADLAKRRGFRDVFLNPADIGGRFSALSLFGLVPAALLGVPLTDLVEAGERMAEACRRPDESNPGLLLGATMAAAAQAGRDKLTLVLPPALASLGLWVEQLVAESTGKQGRGLLPVVDESLGSPDLYGDDRLFVHIETGAGDPDTQRALEALEHAGHPVVRIGTRVDDVGAEFFRWEFATAVAGAVLELNPFDEPNVTEAKERTRRALESYEATGQLPAEGALATAPGLTVFGPAALSAPTADGVAAAALDSLRPGDYVAFLSYLPAGAPASSAVDEARLRIRARWRAATTVGTGPRYLHSTGQYHKGGPDSGVFFVLTQQESAGDRVPGLPYSFQTLKQAQAIGDFQALADRGRRVIRIHLAADAGHLELRALFAAATAQDRD